MNGKLSLFRNSIDSTLFSENKRNKVPDGNQPTDVLLGIVSKLS